MAGRGEDPGAVALAHATLRWQAEVENAQRLSGRVTSILTLAAALAALGVFKLGALEPVEPGWALALVRILLIASLALMGIGLAKAMLVPIRTTSGRDGGSRPSPPPFASGYLHWPAGPEQQPSTLTDVRAALVIAGAQTTKAATSLYHRNVARKESIDRSERFLLAAMAAAGLAIVCYILTERATLDPAPSQPRTQVTPK